MSYIDAQNNFLRWGVLLKKEERKSYIFLTLKLWDGDVDWNAPFLVWGSHLLSTIPWFSKSVLGRFFKYIFYISDVMQCIFI